MNLDNYVQFERVEEGVIRDGKLMPFQESNTPAEDKAVATTLIVTNYNREGTIEGALDSALACSSEEGEVEILVVDDGSTDRSKEILRGYADRGLVRLVELGFNSGSEALPKNIAAFLASGEYLSYLDSDDRMGDRDAFDTSLRVLREHPEAAMTVSNLIFEVNCTRDQIAQSMPWLLEVDLYDAPEALRDPRACEYRRRMAEEHSVFELLNHGYYDAFKLMRKRLYLETGGLVESLKSCGDFGTYLRLNRHGSTIPIQRDFYVYRIHGENDSFYDVDYAAFIEAQHRAFALEEIRHRGLSYDSLRENCQEEFWARYRFTREEVLGPQNI